MFEIKVSPEDVNAAVAKTILDSTFGKNFSDAVNKAMNEVLTGYRSPVSEICQTAVRDYVKTVLSIDEYKERLKALIAKHLTQEYVDKVMGRALSRAIEELKEDRY